MEAPDKIYLEKSLSFPDKFHSHWYKEDIVGNGVEYIRKDALLEWAKNRKWQVDPDFEFGEGFQDALDSLINYINEL